MAIAATAVAPAATSEPLCNPVINACRTPFAAVSRTTGGSLAATRRPATIDRWASEVAAAARRAP